MTAACRRRDLWTVALRCCREATTMSNLASRSNDEQTAEFEAKLGRRLYREERKALERGEDIVARAALISRIEAKLGRRLGRSHVQAILRGEHVLPSAVTGETWMAHPADHARGKFRIVRGGAIESNRRRH